MKFQKHISVISLFFMLACFFSCNKENPLKDGVFSGTGEGRNGEIEVSVTIKDGKVFDAKITAENETPEIALPAKEQIIAQFIKNGSTKEIDVVSGATLTSDGILDALEDALSKSKGVSVSEISYSDTECDVVIIGAGGAGLVAATECASKGAKVIVLEKMGVVGGNAISSTGGINASYTSEQERLGITDSPEIFYEDTMKGGKYLNDKNLVRTLVDNSSAIVEWLQSPMIGADLSDVGIFGGATNKRIHRPKGGAAIGSHLIPLLHKSALEQGAEIRLNNKVVDILSDKAGTKATGVRVSAKGSEYTILAKAVIIASGGFGANPQMVELYSPSLKGFGTTNHKGATGDAFEMVKKFNAELIQMEQIQIHPTVVKGSGAMITEAVRGNGAILIYKNGKRFVNEMETRDIVSAAILKSPQKAAYLVFDQSVRESLKAIEGYAKAGFLTEGETLSALAEKLGISVADFESTIAAYNSFVQNKTDADFGRNPSSMERTIEKAPFYAIEIEPAIHHTMGGLKIDSNAHVLNKDGEIIQALFAAGEVTGGVHGAERLGGNAVADFCVFGKIAADSALAFVETSL